MRPAIDIDGVLRDFCGSLVRQYREDFPDHWSTDADKIDQWELHPFFQIGKGIYDYAFKKRAMEIFEKAQPFPGTWEFMEDLKHDNHVCLLTQQPKGKEIHTLNWLYEWDIPYDSIAFTGEKQLFDYSILLDDAEHNLRAARDAGKRAVCFDRPYNQKWDGERVKTFSQFLDKINGHS